MSPCAAHVVASDVAINLPPNVARQLRRLADYTQAELARAANVPYPRLVGFEHSRVHLDAGEIHRVFAALLPRLIEALALLATVVEPAHGRVGADDVAS